MATVSGTAGSDNLSGTSDDDSIDGKEGHDFIEAGAGDDVVEGGDGWDDLYGDGGNDTISGGAGEDWVYGGTGNDSIFGGTDSDLVVGEEGKDTLFGGAGNDSVSGHEGDDALHGDAGADSLFGGSGDDYFDGGTGSDQYFMDRDAGGGDNDISQTDIDVVRFEPGMGHDTAYDFEGGTDFVYIGALTGSDITVTQLSAASWKLTIAGYPNDSLTLNFVVGTEPGSATDFKNHIITEDDYTPPQNGDPAIWHLACFTEKSLILTPRGLRQIGHLRVGDRVVTADHGSQPILAISKTTVTAAQMADNPALSPVVIEEGAFGKGLPHWRMLVSRQHGFAALGGRALVRAAHLVGPGGLARVQNNRPNCVRYVHILLPLHELVQVEGVWTESFFNNPNQKTSLSQRFQGFPLKVAHHKSRCRPLLTQKEIRRFNGTFEGLGQLKRQSDPRTIGADPTASAPAGVSP